jgi:hypothetical protein
MKTKILVGVLAGVVLLGSIAASPYITLYQMRGAMQDGDADAFSKHVDFPALRENFKGQMMAFMNREMESPEMAGNPFAGFGKAMAVAFIGPMVDNLISPAGVIAMMKSNSVSLSAAKKSGTSTSDASPAAASKPAPDYAIDYRGWDKVVVHGKDASDDRGGFVFRRNGIWDWKLSAVELPDDFMKTAK